jgi:ABC-type nitrate/sulfonate/bicarbonate transport system substrate-binding protein
MRHARRAAPAANAARKFSRSKVIAVAALAVMAAVVAVTTSSAAETLRVGKAGREAFSFVPVDVGAQVGIFNKHDLDLEISSFGGDARIQQAMAADSIDVALGSGPGLAFIVKGSPIRGIAAMAGPPLLFALMVRADDIVKTVDDLRGHKVAVSTVGSVTSWIVSEVSRQKSWGFEGIEQVPLGNDATRIAALRAKSVDAAVVNLAVALNFVQRGEGRILLRFNDLLKDFHAHVIFASDKAIAAKPQALHEFLKGWFETIAFMRENKAETIRIAKDIMGTNEETAGLIYEELMPMFSDTGKFEPKALAVLSRSFVEMKTLPSEPDMSKLYTEAFLPKN